MLKAKFIKEIGVRYELRAYWGDGCKPYGCHNATVHLADELGVKETIRDGNISDYPDELWPTKCDHCDAEVPADAKRQVNSKRLFDTQSGKPEPGSLFWANWLPEDFYWDNHKGPHLMAILPNGDEWNIDSRAANCGSPEDKTHRCWVRTGDPETGEITVGKGGHTCKAGAGSIQSGDYHGYLDQGYFKQNR